MEVSHENEFQGGATGDERMYCRISRGRLRKKKQKPEFVTELQRHG